jgi:hypothetical protein
VMPLEAEGISSNRGGAAPLLRPARAPQPLRARNLRREKGPGIARDAQAASIRRRAPPASGITNEIDR